MRMDVAFFTLLLMLETEVNSNKPIENAAIPVK